ncbi:MAG: prefoldin subunit 5, partial [Candidatus Omnitrophota bacterium]
MIERLKKYYFLIEESNIYIYTINIMIKYILPIFVFMFLTSPAAAQSAYGSKRNNVTVYQSFNEIKRSISFLLKENNQLEEYHRVWQSKLGLIHQELNQKQGEVNNLRRKSGLFIEPNNLPNGIQNDIEALKSEVLIKRGRMAYLQGKLIEMEDKHQLWELQLKDLEYEKLQVEMGQREDKFEGKDVAIRMKEEVSRLEQRIRALQKEEQEYSQSYQDLKSFIGSTNSGVIGRVRKDINHLEETIRKLQKQKKLVYREKANFKDKEILAGHLHKGDIEVLSKEHAGLSRGVTRLEA